MGTRLMTMRMIFRDTVMAGKYTVEVLGKSGGPYRSRLRNMVAKSVAELAKKEDGVEVKDLQMKIDIGNIKVQMECLFPNEETCADPEARRQQHDGSLLSSNHWNRWRHRKRLPQCGFWTHG